MRVAGHLIESGRGVVVCIIESVLHVVVDFVALHDFDVYFVSGTVLNCGIVDSRKIVEADQFVHGFFISARCESESVFAGPV